MASYRTDLGVPLLRDGIPIGVIALMRTAVRPFTDKQIELVTTFADQAVIAIENVRLFDDVQARTRELSEALQQQTATSEVLQVSSAPRRANLQPVFEAMLANATRICEAKFGVLFRYDGDAFRSGGQRGRAAGILRISRTARSVLAAARKQPRSPLAHEGNRPKRRSCSGKRPEIRRSDLAAPGHMSPCQCSRTMS